MAHQELLDSVGKYIDKYYVPENDDINMDSNMKSIFDKISLFRKKKEEAKETGESVSADDYEMGLRMGNICQLIHCIIGIHLICCRNLL